MDKSAFEQIIKEHGKDILRFCRMTTGSRDEGDELYQDTMLLLFEKTDTLDNTRNVKGYAISTAMLLWKNKKRKYARRNRIALMQSIDGLEENNIQAASLTETTLEEGVINREEIIQVRHAVKSLPEKYSIVIYMYYSAQMTIAEISETLHIPQGTVKTRMQKAKSILKCKLEALS